MPPQVVRIESIDDPRVELYRNIRDRDLYGRERVFVAESEMVIRRLLPFAHRIRSLLLTPARYEVLRNELDVLPESVPVYVAEMDVLCDVAGFHIHRGALAIAERPSAEELSVPYLLGHLTDRAELRLLLAEGITNVDNVGGLVRAAAAFGIDAVVFDSTCCDPLYRKAVRVSVGHVLTVPWAISTDWIGDLEKLKQQWGFTLIAAESTDAAIPLWDVPETQRWALIVGSEASGVAAESLNCCDFVAEIPMHRDVPSINVASAAAVAMYELLRP